MRRRGRAQLPPVVARALPEHGAAAARPGRRAPRRHARRRAVRRSSRTATRSSVRGGEMLPPRRGGRHGRRSRSPTRVRALNDERRREIGEALEAFARNTIEHMLEERELLAGKLELPALRHRLPRPAGAGRRARRRPPASDLRALRPYIRDVRPALVGVDGGAERADRGGLHAGHDRRRHGLGAGADAALRRRARRPRLPRRPRAGPRAPRGARACRTSSCPRRARARTSRC